MQRKFQCRTVTPQAMNCMSRARLNFIRLETKWNLKLISRKTTKAVLPPPLALMSQVAPTATTSFSSRSSGSPASPCTLTLLIRMGVGTTTVSLPSSKRYGLRQLDTAGSSTVFGVQTRKLGGVQLLVFLWEVILGSFTIFFSVFLTMSA